jgi:hypothetical protein
MQKSGLTPIRAVVTKPRAPYWLATAGSACVLFACAQMAPRVVATGPVPIPPGATVTTRPGELPSWLIPNVPLAAEAYYGPDSYHLIAQVQSKLAMKSLRGAYGYLTHTFTDDVSFHVDPGETCVLLGRSGVDNAVDADDASSDHQEISLNHKCGLIWTSYEFWKLQVTVSSESWICPPQGIQASMATPGVGVEPTSPCLTDKRSTTELPRNPI